MLSLQNLLRSNLTFRLQLSSWYISLELALLDFGSFVNWLGGSILLKLTVLCSGELDGNRPVPFRLTPNISELLTPIGISGPHTASAISVARCLVTPNFKVNTRNTYDLLTCQKYKTVWWWVTYWFINKWIYVYHKMRSTMKVQLCY